MLPLVLNLKLLLSPHNGRINPGARLAGIVATLIVAIFTARLFGALTGIGGGFSYMHFNQLQSVVILVLVFLSMALNFGFLLMAIDRLRNEVADLALLDDLTGVGNRRHLVQRLTEECARSERSGEPFALLVIDLDGFKGINDTYGHAAGDACLQHFTLMAQTRSAARRHAGAHRRRRILHRVAILDAARRRDDRPPHPGGLPRPMPINARAPRSRSRSRSASRNGAARSARSRTG